MRVEARVPSCAWMWNAARLTVVAARKASERTSEQASKQTARDCPPVSPTPSMPWRAHGLRTHGGEWGSPSRSSRHPLRERRRASTRRGAIILTSQDGGGHGGPVRAHARQGRQDPRDRRVRATGHRRRVLRSRCQVLPGRIARRHQEVSVPATWTLRASDSSSFLSFRGFIFHFVSPGPPLCHYSPLSQIVHPWFRSNSSLFWPIVGRRKLRASVSCRCSQAKVSARLFCRVCIYIVFHGGRRVARVYVWNVFDKNAADGTVSSTNFELDRN